MKYMVLMYANPAESKAMTADQHETIQRKHEVLRNELTGSGELLNGAGLAFPEDTTNLRLRDGVAVSGNGSLADAEEHLTAYYVIDCADRARALSIAERMLDFHVTAVEVRYIHDSVGIPDR